MPTLAEKIRQARIARGLTQKELALLLDSTESHICRWEHGLTPSAASLLRLSKTLKVPLTPAEPPQEAAK